MRDLYRLRGAMYLLSRPSLRQRRPPVSLLESLAFTIAPAPSAALNARLSAARVRTGIAWWSRVGHGIWIRTGNAGFSRISRSMLAAALDLDRVERRRSCCEVGTSTHSTSLSTCHPCRTRKRRTGHRGAAPRVGS